MRNWFTLAIAAVLITACGGGETQQAAPAPTPAPAPSSKWSPQQVTEKKTTCVNNALSYYSNYGVTKQQWETYCGCIVDAIAQKWTYEDFHKNISSYTSQLVKDGTDTSCQKTAKIQ